MWFGVIGAVILQSCRLDKDTCKLNATGEESLVNFTFALEYYSVIIKIHIGMDDDIMRWWVIWAWAIFGSDRIFYLLLFLVKV